MSVAIDTEGAQWPPQPRWGRRLAVLALLLGLAGLGYAVSPAIGVARLLQAARAGDQAGIEARVHFPKLRRSIARQIVAEALRRHDLQGVDRQLAVSAGTTALAAGLDHLISAKTLADLLSGRAVAVEGPAALDLSALQLAPAGSAVAIWWRSGFTGPMSYEFVADRLVQGAPADGDGIRLGLELYGVTWRVVSLTLPTDLREDLIRRAGAAMRPSR